MASQEPTKAVEENDATVPEPPKEPRPNPLDEKCVALNPFNRYFFHYLNRIFDVRACFNSDDQGVPQTLLFIT